jgi:hypothetical protein
MLKINFKIYQIIFTIVIINIFLIKINSQLDVKNTNYNNTNINTNEENDNQLKIEEDKSDIQKMIDNLNLNFTDNNNNNLNPKLIIGLIVSQISLKFDEIIPLLSNVNDLKGTSHLDKFNANLKLIKQNFTIHELNVLKSNIDEFIFENTDDKNLENNNDNNNKNPNNNQYQEDSSIKSMNKKSEVIDKFKNFSKFLYTIVNDIKYFKLENLNNGLNLDWENLKNNYGLPNECNQDCKCCKENQCVNEEICLNQITISEKDQTNIFSRIFDLKFYISLIVCFLIIFGIYYYRKKRNSNSEKLDYSIQENKESYDNDIISIQRNDIEMT